MLTYHEVMTARLTALTTAAERWDGMAAEFAKQETAYRRDVHGVSTGPGWTGLSATAAHARFDATLKEYGYAQTEAKAIASLLRDAHAQFTGLRGRVEAARTDAVAAGMRVSERGAVSLGEGRGQDWDEGEGHEAVARWQERLDRAVRDVADADDGVRIALTAAVVDSDVLVGGRGFNGRALGDVEKYEAAETEGLLGRVSRGCHLSHRELAELRRLFRDNEDDGTFSRTLLDDLGASGTIRLTNELNDVIHGSGGTGGDYASVERGLADTLATATRDTGSAWYRHWRAQMRKAGIAHFATQAQGAYLDKAVGYQSLVTLMEKGHGYSPAMLGDLTDDMIRAERENPGVWRLKGDYSGKRGGWFANDPVDGMLGIMSHDPAGAAHYLNSGDHLRYLMKDRDWNVALHTQEGPKVATYTPGPDGDDRTGFGAALQAAATGIDPADRHGHYVAHTPENDAVFKNSLKYLADSEDEFPPSLRKPVAAMLVNHGGAVHAGMSEVAISESPLDQHELFEVAKQVSKDKDAYGTLNGGLNQAMVAGIHGDHSHSTESLVRAGRTVGFLEEARIQAQGDPKTAEFTTKPIFDKAIGYIPVVGGDVQEGFDYVTDQWLADEQERIDDSQTKESVDAYDRRNGQLMALAAEWSKGPRENSSNFDSRAEIGRSAEDGVAHAAGVSGVRPK
ncbi:hypothetical protein [Streptomyces sp. NPDC047000]|uniref:hypothetical protein n=1 Tax=Streptomyces sp. NPDC047000 TaxID=3155474 RepID=UPI0033D4FC02